MHVHRPLPDESRASTASSLIKRFQSQIQSDEAPLVPVSAFGSPAPPPVPPGGRRSIGGGVIPLGVRMDEARKSLEGSHKARASLAPAQTASSTSTPVPPTPMADPVPDAQAIPPSPPSTTPPIPTRTPSPLPSLPTVTKPSLDVPTSSTAPASSSLDAAGDPAITSLPTTLEGLSRPRDEWECEWSNHFEQNWGWNGSKKGVNVVGIGFVVKGSVEPGVKGICSSAPPSPAKKAEQAVGGAVTAKEGEDVVPRAEVEDVPEPQPQPEPEPDFSADGEEDDGVEKESEEAPASTEEETHTAEGEPEQEQEMDGTTAEAEVEDAEPEVEGTNIDESEEIPDIPSEDEGGNVQPEEQSEGGAEGGEEKVFKGFGPGRPLGMIPIPMEEYTDENGETKIRAKGAELINAAGNKEAESVPTLSADELGPQADRAATAMPSDARPESSPLLFLPYMHTLPRTLPWSKHLLQRTTHTMAKVNVRTPDSKEYFPHNTPAVGSLLDTSVYPQNKDGPLLFQPIKIGPTTFKNRVFVAPMCQYSAESGTGLPTTWHLVHLGGFAVRGAATVIQEATSVLPNGGLSPEDLGIWSDAHTEAYKPITAFIKAQGAVPGIQLAHGGRKSSTLAPWVEAPMTHPEEAVGRSFARPGEENGWEDVWAPSAIPFKGGAYPEPIAMSLEDIETFKKAWGDATQRAVDAGFELVEIHSAHGYMLHNFLSPLSNHRTDKYGGSLENRLRLPLEIIELTRQILPSSIPLFLRISATDWHPAGEKNEAGEWISWGPEQSEVYLKEAIKKGIALMDVSSGGNDVNQKITVGPGYQVPFAEKLRASLSDEERIPISSVGLITSGKQAEEILQAGKADVISVAREFLRDPNCVFNWAQELDVAVKPPVQYERAFTRMLKH
ncbi:hypothetical protein MNV49_006390 [Pseudohyphozyma bogoriensis]|nr:hypothetical protein MNV49_006390 [Pseudohyphozyma bogoriensis]